MAVNFVFRVRWRYVDAGGKPLQQYPEQAADFIANVVQTGSGSAYPDANDLKNVRIPLNFPTPAGATIALLGISSSQTPGVYS